MATYRSWDIVLVPFPYSDSQASKLRPALVVSTDVLHQRNGKFFLAMITSASNAAQYGDVPIGDFQSAGLPVPSVVRASKLAVVEEGQIYRRLGTLPQTDRRQISKQIREYLAVGA